MRANEQMKPQTNHGKVPVEIRRDSNNMQQSMQHSEKVKKQEKRDASSIALTLPDCHWAYYKRNVLQLTDVIFLFFNYFEQSKTIVSLYTVTYIAEMTKVYLDFD